MDTTPDKLETREPNRCNATKAGGGTCGAYAVRGSETCFYHGCSVEAWAAARQARVRGGKASAKNVRIERQLSPRLRSLLQIIESAVEKVEQGEMQPATAQALSSLSNSLLRVYSVAEIELQLKHLESVAPIAPKRIVARTGRKDINDG